MSIFKYLAFLLLATGFRSHKNGFVLQDLHRLSNPRDTHQPFARDSKSS